MEEEERAPPLVLLGRDQALREPLRLGLAVARLRAGASSRPRGREVGEHRRAHVIPAVERLRAGQLQVAEPLAVHGQRDDHPLAPRARLVPGRPRGRRMRALRASKRRFASSHVRSRISVASRVDDTAPMGVHQRLEEDRLRLKLVLGRLVAPPLRDDQVEREGSEEGGRGDEPLRPATAASPKARPSAPTSAAPTVQATRMPRTS